MPRRQDYIRRVRRQGKPRFVRAVHPLPPDRIHLLQLRAPVYTRPKVQGQPQLLFFHKTGLQPLAPSFFWLRSNPIVRKKIQGRATFIIPAPPKPPAFRIPFPRQPIYIWKRVVTLNVMHKRMLTHHWILAGLLPSSPIVAL